ncbi:hypothetical protein, partial [Candidatus Albibeggiatoa sp. nov. NOAA]|uniref:hypothetical protein n=1 Tax=Candidatus Albibeggiatoa sp. nov. NOAA TaxID=3162724 RepID=UPI0032F8AF12|nr:hypothetical protein [Thiotrichaceae bacterium]
PSFGINFCSIQHQKPPRLRGAFLTYFPYLFKCAAELSCLQKHQTNAFQPAIFDRFHAEIPQI